MVSHNTLAPTRALALLLALAGALGLAATAAAQAPRSAPAAQAAGAPVAAPSPAPPAPPVPEQVARTFGDWTHRCARNGPEPAPSRCEVVAAVQAQAPGVAPVALQFAIAPSERPNHLRVAVAVPTNTAVGVPLRLAREGGAAAAALPELSYDLCVPAFCRAVVEVEAAVLERFAADSGEGRVRYRTASGVDFVVGVSLLGFPEALAALRAPPRRG